MNNFFPALRFNLFMILLLGILYPFTMTFLAKITFSDKANVEWVVVNNQIVGAKLIGQKFSTNKYFWPRPSAVDYNPLPSGGSNLSQNSSDLIKNVEDRLYSLKKINPDELLLPPQDLIFSSASGLDPHITVEAARYQVSRVAKSRGLDQKSVLNLVDRHVEKRQMGFLGEMTVNVLMLNVAVDELSKKEKQ